LRWWRWTCGDELTKIVVRLSAVGDFKQQVADLRKRLLTAKIKDVILRPKPGRRVVIQCEDGGMDQTKWSTLMYLWSFEFDILDGEPASNE
jgi:hypothetical protein